MARIAAAAYLSVGLAVAQPKAPDFLSEVRPILSGACFKCHGPDSEVRKGGLRLDRREDALRPGRGERRAIVPGDVKSSELVKRILTTDEEEVMPPPAAKHPLSEAQKEILTRWVAAGAPYTPHWAFVKPHRPSVPEPQRKPWARNAIDRFLLDQMEKRGLAPSDEADRHTLVRRVYLDLIGLPPTPEEADGFVSDDAPDAYERLVDRLLASPHYGERWARRWLDLARYADTNGYEKDRPRSIWPYRDWVIRALNDDMPFNQFTVEQLAGDLLPEPTSAQLIATGFHRNAMINEEGGNDPLEYRFHAMVDRVHVTSTAWLGLTMACAQCHTHKYDPIEQREYYQFMAFLNNADEPWMDVPDPEIEAKRQQAAQTIAVLRRELEPKFPAELKADWVAPAQAAFQSEAGNTAERLSDGSFLVEGKAADKDTYTITIDSAEGGWTHLQIQALPDASLTGNGPGRSESGNFVLTGLQVTVASAETPPSTNAVKLARARADFHQAGFPAWDVLDGKDDTGWGVAGAGNWHVARTLTLDFEQPVMLSRGARMTLQLRQQHGKQHVLGRFRVSLGRELNDGRPIDERRREHLDRRLARWIQTESPKAVAWRVLKPVRAVGSHPTLTVEADDSVFASGDFTKSDTYTVDFEGDWRGVRAIRLEMLPDDRLPNRGPGRVAYEGPLGDFFLSDLKLSRDDLALKLKSATESHAKDDNKAAKALDDDLQSGWSIDGGQGRGQNAVFVLEKPLDYEGMLTLRMVCEKYYAAGLGRFRVWATSEEGAVALPHPNDIQDHLLALRGKGEDVDREGANLQLRHYYLSRAPELAEELAEIDKLDREMPKFATTLVMRERPPGHRRSTQVHKRGEFLQPTEEVEPGVPAVLPAIPPGAPLNRLTLARWLVSPEQPLTPRVVMNREWQAFFGRGLVRTMEDFGFQGALPSHPALLDWLAEEWIAQGWRIKPMHKLIVMSAAYRQSSRASSEQWSKDPENVWLARGPRFRLEAELVRDAGLVSSGLLTTKIGGPSVYPPQLPGITTEGAYGPLTWTTSEGPDRYRRSIYTFAKRTAPFAMAQSFDAPSGEACTARRDRSNTPLQALTLLNDEMFLEMARALGTKIAESSSPVEERLAVIFRRCVTRPPTLEEIQQLRAFYDKQLHRFTAGELKAEEFLGSSKGERLAEQAAWTAVARVLLNLDEAITKG